MRPDTAGWLGISQLETISQYALPAHGCFTVILHSCIKCHNLKNVVILLVLCNLVMDYGNMSFNE